MAESGASAVAERPPMMHDVAARVVAGLSGCSAPVSTSLPPRRTCTGVPGTKRRASFAPPSRPPSEQENWKVEIMSEYFRSTVSDSKAV